MGQARRGQAKTRLRRRDGVPSPGPTTKSDPTDYDHVEEAFDPYRKWLGIPPEEQPPNHYRLLGIAVYEEDPDVISHAADRQMAHLRTFQAGKRAALSQAILNEVSAAKVCLLNPHTKRAYDDQLRAAAPAPPPAVATLPLGVAYPAPVATRPMAAEIAPASGLPMARPVAPALRPAPASAVAVADDIDDDGLRAGSLARRLAPAQANCRTEKAQAENTRADKARREKA